MEDIVMEEQPIQLEELVSQAGGEIVGPLEPATRQLTPVEVKLLRLAIERRGNIVSAADVELGETMKLIGLAVDVEYKVDFDTGVVTLPAPQSAGFATREEWADATLYKQVPPGVAPKG